MSRKLMLLVSLLLVLTFSASLAGAQDESFALTIMHTNDTHTWHEPYSGGNGGVALQAAVVNQIRGSVDNSLLLDAGDRFTGTLYHVQYRGADSVQVMNALGYDAMTLGNHEFDDGNDALLSFLNGVNFPVVSANIDFSAFPDLDAKVSAYTVLERGGRQIGIIGVTTPETPIMSKPDAAIVFDTDLVAPIQAAVDALTADGVNVIILLTHIGIEDDKALIPQLSGVDVVLGGHSHTLLSNSYKAAADVYPLVIEDKDGNRVYYAAAGQYNQYLGRMDVQFNADGVVTSAAGDTILLSRYITPDPAMVALLDGLKGPIDELRATPTGADATVLLDGDRAICRVEECALGNLIADAMRAETGAQIAIQNGGGIRANIDAGPISVGDVFTVLPFGNTVATFELTGADVIAALENGVSRITVTDGVVARAGANGRFPQVSGIRFTFDPTLDAGSRIVSVEVQGADGTFSPIDPAATYTLVSNDFMRLGGDGYSVFRDNAINAYDFGRPLNDVLVDYLVANSPVSPVIDGRITMQGATLEPRP